jgi:hypothetical protein
MLGWTLEDVLVYAMLVSCLVFSYFAGKPGSVVARLLFKKGQEPNEKTMKLLRKLGVIGLIIMAICIIASLLLQKNS